jgi:hypothetical protein
LRYRTPSMRIWARVPEPVLVVCVTFPDTAIKYPAMTRQFLCAGMCMWQTLSRAAGIVGISSRV